jgi:[ribosomal protein S5]-alanine N-acetyltransferase
MQNMATIEHLLTDRLILIPYTKQICENVLNENYSDLQALQLVRGTDWPDEDVLDTLPRIINSLCKLEEPSGFESWMIIKKSTREIIGDAGFKGLQKNTNTVDLGYGIIKAERNKGYAYEAVSALVRWAVLQQEVRAITATCQADNLASINLLRKFNFNQISAEQDMLYWRFDKKRFVSNRQD